MIAPSEFFHGVVDVWLWWMLSLTLLAVMMRTAVTRLKWRTVLAFFRDEDGASYVLPYVLTFPVYMLLVCVMIQATMILLCKMGTVYAAYAAARAAIVWRSVEPEAGDEQESKELAEQKALKAAVWAMAPFASSYDSHLAWKNARPSDPESGIYYRAYKRYSPDDLANEAYVRSKHAFAARATTVTVTAEPNEWNKDVVVEVAYEMPMHVPGTGRILGEGDFTNFYRRVVKTSIALQSETPASANRRLGIAYDPRY